MVSDSSNHDDSNKPEDDSLPDPLPDPLNDIAGINFSEQPLDQPVEQPGEQISENLGEAPIELSEPATEIAASSVEASGGDALEKVKEFSEKMPMEKVQVPAAFPFSLLIEGELLPEEKEKLLDVLSRESMGIREVDLEPQLAGNRILIPRISEYAGILLVQALRGTRARMRLGPSDSIFKTEDTESSADPLQAGARASELEHAETPAPDLLHPAEQVAVTPDSKLPQLPEFDVIDTLTASAVLDSTAVEASRSSEYQEVLESLQRELKYKAYRKGAVGIIHFRVDLQQLSLATQYRLSVSGAAVKPRSAETSASSADAHSSLDTSH